MTPEKINELLYAAINASFKAGEEIMAVYNKPFKVQYKSDSSPVTEADKRANTIIETELASFNIPFLTEEGEHAAYAVRKDWRELWIVDPLDGTKEFVKRNGEFTVNIALAIEGKPVIGVIYSPVFRDLYFAAEGLGAFKTNKHKVIELHNSNAKWDLDHLIMISDKLPIPTLKKNYTVVASRSHLSSELYHYIEQLKREKGIVDLTNTGSSIKMCLVAEGLADEYPRFGDTMEWDTCAGQCILEQAGCSLIDQETKLPMRYNRADIKNKWFVAKR